MRTATNLLVTVAVLLLLQQRAVVSVNGAAVCNGAVCSGKTNTIVNNGITYCCPTTGASISATNYVDPSTYSCATTQNCGQCARAWQF